MSPRTITALAALVSGCGLVADLDDYTDGPPATNGVGGTGAAGGGNLVGGAGGTGGAEGGGSAAGGAGGMGAGFALDWQAVLAADPGSEDNRIHAVTPGPDGEVYVAGSYVGSLVSGTSCMLPAVTVQSGFIARFDEGSCTWAYPVRATGKSNLGDVVVYTRSGAEQVIAVGHFGEGPVTYDQTSLVLANGSDFEMLVLAVDPDDGAYIGHRWTESPGNDLARTAIRSDDTLYVGGEFNNVLPTDQGNLSAVAADGVVLEYPLPIVGGNDSAPGQLPAGGWVLGSPAAGGGGGSAEDDSSVHDLVSPASGIVVAAGVFGRTLFTVDAPSLESPNSNSIFVVELNLLDNKANWALAVGAPDMNDDQPVLAQRDGALFLGFRTRDPITVGGKTLDHLNAGEIVLVTVDEGQAVDARSFPSLGHESLAGLAALDEGWPLLVGSDEEGAIDFGTGPIDVTPGAASDGFLAWPDVAVASFSHPRPSEPNPAVDVSAVAVEATSPAGVLIGGRFDRAVDLGGDVIVGHGNDSLFVARLLPPGG